MYFSARSSGGNGGASISPVTVLNGQTVNVSTPPGTWTIGTILFSSVPTPNFINIIKGANTYQFVDGTWYDIVTEEVSNAVPISGDFSVNNGSGVSYTFWNIPPP